MTIFVLPTFFCVIVVENVSLNMSCVSTVEEKLNALNAPTVQCRPVDAPSSSLPAVCRVVNARCPDTFCVA